MRTASVDRPSSHVLLLFVLVAALAPVASRVLPGVLNDYRSLVACFGVAYAVAALPLNLLMGSAGQVSFGHAAFLGVGAFTSGIVAGRLGLPFVVGLVAAMAAGALTTLLIGFPALRIRGLYLGLVTLAFGLAMYSFAFRLPALSGGYAGLPIPRPKVGAFVFSNNGDLLGVAILLLGLVWLVDRNVMRTKVGRAFLALRQDEDIAGTFGVDVRAYKLCAFVLYGALSAAAGSLLGHVIGFAQQEMFTFESSLIFVVIVVLGGTRSRTAVAIAAFLFGAGPRLFVVLNDWLPITGPALVLAGLVLRGRKPSNTDRGAAPERTSVLSRLGHTAALRPAASTADRPLVVRDLSVRFGGVTAVDSVCLDVERATVTGLIGPNGAGKTTLFNAVSGLVHADGGTVCVNGADMTDAPPHRRAAAGVGRTFQQIGLIKDLTVTDNLLLAQHRLCSYGPIAAVGYLPAVARGERSIRRRTSETIGELGLRHLADAPLAELSHGQQRLVEMAAVFLTSPGLLLLDEPTAGLSPAAVEELAKRLVQFRDDFGQTMFVIEHHLPLVMSVCDRVHVMGSGRLLTSGTPAAVRRDPDVVAAYLGSKAG